MFKSYLIKLLTIMTVESPSSQIIVLKRLVKKKRFTKRLYMDKESNSKKVDLLVTFKKKNN